MSKIRRGGRLSGNPPPPLTRRLRHEPLEDRRLLAVITVDTAADLVDFNDGRTSLREAVFAANIVPGADEIRFDFGHDGPATIRLTEGEIQITESLALVGAGRDLLTIDATPAEGEPGNRIFTIVSPRGAARIDAALTGLTLAGGRTGDGAAIFADANVTIADARLIDNRATRSAGAVYSGGGRLELTRVEVADNFANAQAGAVYARGELVVSDSVFLRNSTSGGGGGAILHAGFATTVHIANSRFEHNSAKAGGAVNASTSPLTVDGSTFIANSATSTGGAVQAVAASNYPSKLVLITDSDFADNSAGKTGGALATGGNVEIRDSTISGNNAGSSGGGVYQGVTRTGLLLLHSVTIVDNGAVRGGGVFSLATTTIESSIITNNTAIGPSQSDGRGGGVMHAPSDGAGGLTVRWSTISNNRATTHGGGIHGTTVSILNSTITGNTAGDLAARRGQGGGLYLQAAPVLISHIDSSTITDNTAGLAGGGAFSRNVLVVNRSVVSGNKAGSTGGGLDVAQLTMTASLVTGNAAGSMADNIGKGGGIWFNAGAKPTIDSSTISDNFAGSAGGGFAGNAAVTVTNSTISGNTARTGGGAQGTQLTFRHSTITDNSAIIIRGDLGEGGGLAGANIVLRHTIVAGNHDDAGKAPDVMGSISTASHYSIIGDLRGSNLLAEAPLGVPTAAGLLIGGPLFGPINPLLAPLADNGGPLLPGGTILPTHALLTGSPAFNAGDPNFVPGPAGDAPEFDQRGAPYARKAVLRVDIGAFEQQPPGGLFTADATGDQLADGRDFLAWQREVGIRPPSLPFADFTANGIVNSNDLAVWTARFGANDTGASQIAQQFPPLPSPEWRGAGGEVTEGPSGAELPTLAAAAVDLPPILVTTLDDTINLNDNRTSLREAIFAANIVPGAHAIEFDPALFTAGPGTILLTHGELKITDSLTLTGPGAELFTIDASGNDPTPGVSDRRGSRVFDVGPISAVPVSIAGLTVTGGDISGGGGGIRNGAAALTILNVRIISNFASTGGGIYSAGNLTLLDTDVIENQATRNGGGVYANRSLIVADANFVGNKASNGSFEGGGGLFVEHFSPAQTAISRSTFTNNSGGSGGGVYTTSPVTIVDSLFTGNAAMTSSRGGGAIFLEGVRDRATPSTITGTTIENNTSKKLGGGVANYGALEIHSSTITGNSAVSSGGGIDHGYRSIAGDLLITDSTISGNAAMRGGGISTRGTTTVIGSTIENNYAVSEQSHLGQGGGIYAGRRAISPSTLTIQDSVIVGNRASYQGGGVHCTSQALLISDCTITRNSAESTSSNSGIGGGVFARFPGASQIENSIISENRAARDGGGIWAQQTSLQFSIDGCSILQNAAGNAGGGVFGVGADINRSLIQGNRAGDESSTTGRGGGVYGGIRLNSSMLVGNFASGDGGGLYVFVNGNQITVDQCTIAGNRAYFTGGIAINVANSGFTSRSAVILTHSTITGNWGNVGVGGINANVKNGTLTIRHSTIASNRSLQGAPGDSASGLQIFNFDAAPVSVDHVIIASNSSPFDDAPDFRFQGLVNAKHSLIGNNSATSLPEAPVGAPDAHGNFIGGPIHGPIDPLLAPLADNGGPTLPGGAKLLTHALLPGSPAIDAGDPALKAGVGHTPQFDQRGEPFARIVGTRIDIGALEQTGVPLVVDTLLDESDGDYRRGDVSLREAILLANAQPGPNVIQFDPALTAAGPATILLTHGELAITDSLTLTGPGANLLTIDASGNDPTSGTSGGDASRVFSIDDGNSHSLLDASLHGLTLTGGNLLGNGGAIHSRENLAIIDCVLTGNRVQQGNGGAIFSDGADPQLPNRLVITRSKIAANFADYGGGGGGMFASNSLLEVIDSTISGNQANRGGGIEQLGSHNFSVTNSVIRDNSSSGGGGIKADQLTLANSTVSGNFAFFDGGGGLLVFGDLNLLSSTIQENVSLYGYGGGIAHHGGRLVVTSSTIRENSAGVFGGGIHSRGLLEVDQSHFAGNSARRGGAIYAAAPLVISHTTIMGNRARFHGGGVFARSDLTLTDSQVQSNQAGFGQSVVFGSGGGVFVNEGSRVLVDSSALIDNVATGSGGGIHALNALPGATIVNSTISGNAAQAGGGASGTHFHIRHSTITKNSASALSDHLGIGNLGQDELGAGGGVFANVTLDHAIIAGNHADQPSPDLRTASGLGPIRFSILGDLRGSTITTEAPLGAPDANGNLTGGPIHGLIDPLLAPLADNGSPTLPGGAKLLTHALLPGSPTLNAGDPSLVAGVGDTPEFDQRGAPYSRVVGRIDIGAVEQIPQTLIVDTLADESDGNYSTGDLALREAIELANLQPGPNEIQFDPALTSSRAGTADFQIFLAHGELKITDGLTIIGPGTKLAINARPSDPTFGVENGDGSRIFHVDDGDPSATIEVAISGISLRCGDVAGDGGAIYSLEPLKLSGVMIFDNFATRHGGGVYAAAGLTLADSTFRSNNSAGDGAGVWARGHVDVARTSFITNRATGSGGGLWLAGDVSIVDSIIQRNSAIGEGGGAHIDSDSALNPTSAFIYNTQITDGSAAHGGGLAWDQWTFVSIVNSLVASNRVSGFPGPPTDGAGLFGAGPLVLAHSTVVNNIVSGLIPGSVGGMRVGIAFISNSVVANNTGPNPDIALMPGGHVSAVYSIVGDNRGSGLAETPPGTTDAQGNRIGGPVNGKVNPLLQSLGAPMGNSLTRDAGNPSSAALPPELSEFDIRGVPFGRVIGGRIDIGAYEFQGFVINTGALGADFNASRGPADGFDFLAWQRGFGLAAGATFAQGDATGDHDVDANDYAVWMFRFGAVSPPSPAPAAAALTVADQPASDDPSASPTLALLKRAQALDLALTAAIPSTRIATPPAARRAFDVSALLDPPPHDDPSTTPDAAPIDHALETLFAALR